MSIFIQNLQVQNLGPIDSLQESLGKVNLIYGLNESGKTYLVEFLLQSLFRTSKNWDLRSGTRKGAVQVAGLEQEPVTFTPESSRKLESYWEDQGLGLPLNLARYLVVKGGELALSAGSPGGIDRDTLKSALTSTALLDQIWKSIPSTVRESQIEMGQIQGHNKGMIKKHLEIREEIRDLESLLNQIEDHYSRGPISEIIQKKESVQEQIDGQHRAKRALAHQLRKRSEELKRDRGDLNPKDLQDLRDALRDLGNLNKDLKTLEKKYKKESHLSADYPWLEAALQLWEEKGLQKKNIPARTLGIAGLIGVAAGAVLLILAYYNPWPELVWIGAGLVGIGFGLSLYFGIQTMNWSTQIEDSQERQTIRTEYQEKFDAPLGGLADLKSRKANLQEISISAQTTKKLHDEKIHQRDLLVQSIQNTFASLTGETVPEKNWENQLEGLLERSDTLNKEIQEKDILLSKLDVPEDVPYTGPEEIEYDPEILQNLEMKLDQIESELGLLLSELENLKTRASVITGDPIQDPWNEILHNLQSLRDEQRATYKQLTAELIAKIGLSQVLTRLREEEDHKIVEAINGESVTDLLENISGRYQKLDLIDTQLIVSDAYNSFPLNDLSTGAREQVQLALRLGIASQVCEGNPLFLILDDAFQHSDWNRRESLVLSMLELAQAGWQIIYLSMDDHIRDMFINTIKPVLKKDFKLIHLE